MARRDGYTDAELDAQIQSASPEDREIFKAYIDGINRYIREVVRADPENKLPYEFKVLGFMPAYWTDAGLRRVRRVHGASLRRDRRRGAG